jgi:N-acetylmuramoyl-L-alanine amidase
MYVFLGVVEMTWLTGMELISSMLLHFFSDPFLPVHGSHVVFPFMNDLPQQTQIQVSQTPSTNQSSHASVPADSSKANSIPQESIRSFDQWIMTNSVSNIRTEPSLTSPILLQVPAQSWFPVLKHEGQWDQIRLGSDQTGWIADWIVQTQKNPQQLQLVDVKWNTPKYAGPDLSFSSTGTANPTFTYLPKEVCGNWVQLLTVDTGSSVWVPTQSVVWGYGTVSIPTVRASNISDPPMQTEQPLQGKTIVLDPGHGGADTGAIGTVLPVYERDINLAVARVLESKLEAAGAHVILTRTTNEQFVSLADRVRISNDNHADVFISIHQNMYPEDPSVTGTITYYYDEASSKTLAKDIEEQALASLQSRETKEQMDQEELYVLHHNQQPSILIEGCFLSNPDEAENSILPTYQEKLASGIYHGVLKYFGDRQHATK